MCYILQNEATFFPSPAGDLRDVVPQFATGWDWGHKMGLQGHVCVQPPAVEGIQSDWYNGSVLHPWNSRVPLCQASFSISAWHAMLPLSIINHVHGRVFLKGANVPFHWYSSLNFLTTLVKASYHSEEWFSSGQWRGEWAVDPSLWPMAPTGAHAAVCLCDILGTFCLFFHFIFSFSQHD